MVLEVNAQFHSLNKFVVAFLNEKKNAAEFKDVPTDVFDKLIDSWKSKNNKFKNLVRKTDGPVKNPPRPKSKYIFFCDTVRQKIKEEHPEMNIQQITCELGARWERFKENPDPEIDRELTEAFIKDQERYNKEKKAKTPTDTRKNIYRSDYLFFCDQERKKETNLTMKELGFRWSNLKNDPILYEKFMNVFKQKKQQFETENQTTIEPEPEPDIEPDTDTEPDET